MSVMSSVAVEKDGRATWCLYNYFGLMCFSVSWKLTWCEADADFYRLAAEVALAVVVVVCNIFLVLLSLSCMMT